MRYSDTTWGRRTVSVCTTGARSPSAAVAAIGLLFVFVGCSPNGPEVVTLKRPQWECPTPPTAVAEAGTGAHTDDGFVHLRWLIGDDPDLEGYHIYRRVHPDTFDTLYASVALTPDQLAKPGQVIEWRDEGSVVSASEQPVAYFYVLFAFDRNGNRSPRSDTVGYQLLPKPDLYAPLPKDIVTNPRPIFTFAPSRTVEGFHTFVVRVASDSGANSRVLWVSPRLNPWQVTAGDKTEAQYGSGGIVVRDTLSQGKYKWRVDAQGMPRTSIEAPCRCVFGPTGCPGADSNLPTPEEFSFFGSKSAWKSFTVVP